MIPATRDLRAERRPDGLPSARRFPPATPLRVAVLVLLVHGGLLLVVGSQMAPDSYSYSGWADDLVASGFDYASLGGQASVYPPLLYSLWVSLVAAAKFLFGERWGDAIVAMNLAAEVGVALLLVGLIRRTTRSERAAWLGVGLFLASFEIFNWTHFVLADASFLLLGFAVFALVARSLAADHPAPWLWAAAAGLTVVAVVYRPTGVALVPAGLWAAYLSRGSLARPARGVVVGALALAVVAGSLTFAWFLQDPSRWPFESLAWTIERTSYFYGTGEVVSARLETYHAPPRSLVEYAAITADRFLHFFSFASRGFSAGHNLVSAAFYVPTYLLAMYLLATLWRGDAVLGRRERDVFLASLGFVVAFAVFHAFLQVDFDGRYRLPVVPHLILLAAGGAAVFERRRAPAG